MPWIFFLTVSDEISSPYSRSMPLWKKYFIGRTPRGVWMYLFDTTRETVDSCMPMSSATSRSTIGRRRSMPCSRNSCCWRTIELATLWIVRWRWSIDLISQTAERIFSLMNCWASACLPSLRILLSIWR